MTKDEALRTALKSLEFYYDLWKEKVDAQTITAIREALVQPEFVLNGIDCSCGRKWRVVNNTLTASEQPEQEPVAWMREDEDCTDCIVWEQTEEHTIPLYTTPPQREWVGLTDEEKHDCYLRIDIWSRCVEMVEAKLREKNGC